MPVIPTYQQRVSIPGVSGNAPMNVGAAGVVGQAIAEGGAVLNRAIELDLQKNDNALIEAGSKVNDEILTFEQSFKNDYQGSDAVGSQAKVNAFVADLTKRYSLPHKDSDFKLKAHILTHADALKNRLAGFEAAEIQKSSNIVRSMDLDSSIGLATSGQVDIAMENYSRTLETQKANKSLSQQEYELEKKHGSSAIYKAYIDRLMVNDPASAYKVFDAVKRDLTQEVRASLENQVKTRYVHQQGMDIATDIFKADGGAGNLESMIDQAKGMNLAPEVLKETIGNIKDQYIVRQRDLAAQGEQAKDAALRSLTTTGRIPHAQMQSLLELEPKFAYELQQTQRREQEHRVALARAEARERKAAAEEEAYRALVTTGSLSKSQIDSLAKTNPEAAYKIAREETRAIKADAELRRLEQSNNLTQIIYEGDILKRDIKNDLATGYIGLKEYDYLVKFQKQNDPVKNETVKRAISQVMSGTTMRKALKFDADDINDAMVWQSKYADLIRAFAENHISDPDFDRKMSEYMEKYVLNDMVTEVFKSRDEERLAKFNAAREISGTPKQTVTSAPALKSTHPSTKDDGYPTEPPEPGATLTPSGEWALKLPNGKYKLWERRAK